jgi:hypothetical protein
MRAEVSAFEWPPDLERQGLDRSEVRSTPLVFIARPLGGQGGETFQLTVCTPDGLTDLLARDGALVGRHFLFVPIVSTDHVEAFIRDRLRRLEGDSWTALADKIGRIAYWEFEDYSEAD